MGLFFFIVGLALVVLGAAAWWFASAADVPPAPPPGRDDFGCPFRTGDSDARRQKAVSAKRGAKLAGTLLILIGGLTILFDSYTIVEARSVAVQTAFGKVQGPPLKSGFHWVAPWHNIEHFDASVQTLKFYKSEKQDDGDCITVRLANNTNACVDVTTQWAINHQGNVNELYLKYRSFDNIHDNLVKRQLQSALNEVFGSYDPLAVIGSDTDPAKDVPAVNTKQLQDRVRNVFQHDLGGTIVIDSVTIPIIHFDGDTENRLRAYQQAKADTRIAQQQKATALAQAEANKILADQAAVRDSGVQYQNCLNLIRDLAQRDQLKALPPTFTCGSAGTSPILLQPK